MFTLIYIYMFLCRCQLQGGCFALLLWGEPVRTYALLNHQAHAEPFMSNDVLDEKRWSYQHIASKLDQG